MIFLDANVLIAHLVHAHPFHQRASGLLQHLLNSDESFVISPQIVGEIYAVVTSKRMVSTPPSPAQVKEAIERVVNDPAVTIVSPGRNTIEICLEASTAQGLTSARVFDLLIYGTMREHDIARLATFNTKDFIQLEGIELVSIPESSTP